MVKCRNHPYEQGVGVCASCLRERLLALLAAQSGRPQHCCAGVPVQQAPPGAAAPHPTHQQQQKQPLPPLAFPRSVSPYVSHRRSADLDFLPDAEEDRRRRRQPVRFYSTPQVGPTAGTRKNAGAGLSIFSSLFGGGRHSRSEYADRNGAAERSSWFTALVLMWRKKTRKNEGSQHFTAEEESMRRRRGKAWCRHRGMSPAVVESGGEEGSETGSGYSSESSSEWRRRPEPTPLRKPVPPAHRGMAGFVVCLSPLVRASPRRSHVVDGGGAAGLSGELGGQSRHIRRHHHHRHASGGTGPPSLGPNRSRKLVDFGRFR